MRTCLKSKLSCITRWRETDSVSLESATYPLIDFFMAQCTAKSKRTKERCKRFAVADRTVCKHHGGKTPRGFAHPNLKNGKYSKFINHLPESLKADFHKNLGDDKDPQSLREQVAISNIRTQQLLALLEDGDLGNLWSQMKEHLSAIKNNLELGLDISADINGMENLTRIGESNFKTWQQINNQNEQTRKLADTQIKIELGNLDRQIKENNYIPKEFVRTFVLEMDDVVMKLSPESVRHEQLKQIQKRFMSLPPVIRDDDAPKQDDASMSDARAGRVAAAERRGQTLAITSSGESKFWKKCFGRKKIG